ncbi:hypothetical protein K3172_03230 [Qipengyuania sp. 6B39]|uniref:hypothetical protein n=1 Tax=Qipengyuania proteolytica TaxID=2867239 RepID=UPI001C896389|nr:hypothetical protein [Qipengyuania proteolytica]MBX7494868.1 hypothetical protein [Qipengyuania proteolytica]
MTTKVFLYFACLVGPYGFYQMFYPMGGLRPDFSRYGPLARLAGRLVKPLVVGSGIVLALAAYLRGSGHSEPAFWLAMAGVGGVAPLMVPGLLAYVQRIRSSRDARRLAPGRARSGPVYHGHQD